VAHLQPTHSQRLADFSNCMCVVRYVLMMVINSKLRLQKLTSFIYGLFTDTGSSSDYL
jgi:hypothetical protein